MVIEAGFPAKSVLTTLGQVAQTRALSKFVSENRSLPPRFVTPGQWLASTAAERPHPRETGQTENARHIGQYDVHTSMCSCSWVSIVVPTISICIFASSARYSLVFAELFRMGSKISDYDAPGGHNEGIEYWSRQKSHS
jgi:hypothetical protein